MKSFRLINNISGWIVFAIAAAVYTMTIEPTASFWDCGEFISTADKLEVGHPPGAPFFMLTARFFTLFASDQAHVAMMVNTFSALCSGLCILFLFWTITHLVRRALIEEEEDLSAGNIIAIIGSGVVGALAYTFSDTFWFSAVEGEVYAFSSLFTAVVFWAMLKWEDVADQPHANRWLVLIAYLMGLSIGVHLLNLLAVPVLALVYYYKKYEPSVKGTLLTLGISFVLLAIILYGLVPGFVQVAGWFELLFVNVFGFGFNIGTLFYAMLTVGCLVWGIIETYKEKDDEPASTFTGSNLRSRIAFILSISLLGIPFFGSHILLGIILIVALCMVLFLKRKWVNMPMLNLILLCSAVILLGYSSYATIVIRSAANTPMDQNSPDDVFTLKSYLNRDQYGDTPLLYGESYAAEYKRVKDNDGWKVDSKQGEALWAKKIKSAPGEPDQYEMYGHKEKYRYVDAFNMIFPRMYSKQQSHINAYKEWGSIKGRKIQYENMGQTQSATVPTFGENLMFFFRYQVGFMYWRYFMWNFVGRQNDIQGHGEVTNGNWISGINFIDSFILGDQSNLPDLQKNNKGRNTYFFLPLILGILGILYMISDKRRSMQNFWLTFILFFMTGLAIVLYLNQTPYQPRERDYAYAGSFYAFCIWIGFGVMFITKCLSSILGKKLSATIATLICLPVPALMAAQNWDDHDRSGRYTARDFGQNYLLSVAPNAIIFTNGDNDTFPLWYNQEVEGVRTDVRVANLSYLQMGWYVDQMKRQAYESQALPISLKPEQYSNGKLDVAYILNMINDSIEVADAMTVLTSPDPRYKQLAGYGNDFDFIPSNKMYLPVDPDAAIESGTVQAKDSDMIVTNMDIDLGDKRYLGKHEIMILDMLQHNNWERPIYYAVTVGNDSYLGLRDYFQLEGLAYRIVPIKDKDGRVNTEAMYDNMMHKFKWGGIENPKVYLDENNLRMTTTFRHMFYRLVDALMKEGKKDSAIAALDYCMKVIPSSTVPNSYVSLLLANQYLLLDQGDKANVIISDLKKTSLQYLNWISAMDPSIRKKAMGEFEEYLGIFSEILRIEEKYDNESFEPDYELLKKYSNIYKSYGK